MMQELDELFGTQTPDGMVEACRMTVRKGIGIGLIIGEALNEWIDRLFALIDKE